MKASFAIAAAVPPQAPIATPGHTGAFRTTLSSLLAAPAHSATQAALPADSGGPGGDTAGAFAGASNLIGGGSSQKTHPEELSPFAGQPQPGIEEVTAESVTGALPNRGAKLLSPARNVPTMSTAKTERARYSVPEQGDATNLGGPSSHSSNRQGVSDQPPGSGVCLPLSPPATPNVHSPELKATPQPVAQETGTRSSQPQVPAKALVPAASQMQTAAGPAPTFSYAAFVPHNSSVSHANSREIAEPSPGHRASQMSLPGSSPLASHNQGLRTTVSAPPASRASHSNTPQTVAATKPAKASETVEGQDHAAERLRLSAPVAPHGTLAPQVKEISSQGTPGKMNDLATTPPPGLHPTADSSRFTAAPVASQAAAQTTVSNVLQRMDTAVPAQSLSLRADSRHLDVGVQSSTFGWIEVRATSGGSGSVDATIHVQSDVLAKDIAAHSGNIVAFAREHSVGVGQLSVGVGGDDGKQEHGHPQQAAGEQERNEAEVPPLAISRDAQSDLSLISIRA